MPEDRSHPDLGDRYRVERLIGRGYLASVWLVTEAETGKHRVAKVFDRSRLAPEIAIYLRHLQQIAEALPLSAAGHVRLPRLTYERGDVFCQIYDYVAHAKTLGQLIEEHAVSVRIAFDVLGQLALALSTLHESDVIHADVKPSNILVQMHADTPDVHLIDFGMVQAQSADTVFLVGTLAYLPPSLAPELSTRRTTAAHTTFVAKAGPYIDLFSAGAVALEMFIGEWQRPAVVTPEVVDSLLQRNPELRARADLRLGAANLIARMLSVSATGERITAAEVASLAHTLLADSLKIAPPISVTPSVKEGPVAVDPMLTRLELVAERLARSTAALIAADGTLRLAVSPEQEQATLSDINVTFANALARTRVSWRVSLLFTVVIFIIIAAMVALAVALTVTTGQKQWGVIFGGATVFMVLGVLIWKPFGKLFEATNQAQQIELIHVRTIAGFRGTTLVEERTRLCTEALNELRTILQPQSVSRGRRSSRGSGTSKGEKSA